MREKGEFIESTYVRADHLALTDFVTKILQKFGVPGEDAAITSQNLVKADLRGIESHGVVSLKRYVDGLKTGVVKARPDIRILKETPVTALVDGDFGLGQVVSAKAMALAMEKAKKSDVGLVSVRHSNHFGIAGFYGLMAVEQDLIGLVMTNAQPTVAPTFAKKGKIGTNPICIAAPTGGKGFVLDMATSAATVGKIQIYRRFGMKIPMGWIIDSEGNLTDNPFSIGQDALLPIGGLGEVLAGHKGYGLGTVVDIFSGILSGANWSEAVGKTQGPNPANVGHFFGAINPEAFMPLFDFKSRMDQFITSIKSTEKLPSAEEIYVAGEKSAYTEDVRKKIGVALHVETLETLRQLSVETGVPLELAKRT